MAYPDTASGSLTAGSGERSTESETHIDPKADAKAVASTVVKGVDEVTKEAGRQAGAIGEQARAQFEQVTEKAKGLAEEQKDLIAGQIGGVADAMTRVADELQRNNAASAQYARAIADGATRVSDTVRDKDVDAILAMAQDFGRKQPVAFLGAAALLGFAASRFVTASAKRESERPQPTPGTGMTENDLDDATPAYGTPMGEGLGAQGRIG